MLLNSLILKNNKNKGFTLIEMLVSIAVFMTVMVVAVGSLMSIISANKKSQSIKSVVDNVTFVIDSISRDVELGTDYKCDPNINQDDSNPSPVFEGDGNCPGGGTSMMYFDKIKEKYIRYVYIKNITDDTHSNLRKSVCEDEIQEIGTECGSWSAWQNLTAPVSVVNIKNFRFYVLGVGTNETTLVGERKQPRVIITAEGSAGSDSSQSDFMLQTSISQVGRISFSD